MAVSGSNMVRPIAARILPRACTVPISQVKRVNARVRRAVPVARGDLLDRGPAFLVRVRAARRGRPVREVAADLHVVVRELADLRVVHPERLVLARSAQREPGHLVDRGRERSGHDEGVADGGADVGELDVELLPVVVEPPAGDLGVDAVERDHLLAREDAVEE